MPASHLRLLTGLVPVVILLLAVAARPAPEIVQDIDGNVYPVVQLGPQRWLGVNLTTTRFRNGDPIEMVGPEEAWEDAGLARRPAWTHYTPDTTLAPAYGKYYNWYAATDWRGLCPTAWRLPTEADWKALGVILGPEHGRALKAVQDWDGAELAKEWGTEATNTFGFGGLPGGLRGYWGVADMIRINGNWWTATAYNDSLAYGRVLSYHRAVADSNIFQKRYGLNVRCIAEG